MMMLKVVIEYWEVAIKMFFIQLHLTGLVRQAHELNLKVHTYTLRADRLPAYVSTFEELLNIFFKELQVDGVITDFPDQAVEYLRNTFIH